MIKVAMIGAGSVVFCKNLTGDLLGFPEFRNATLAYMDIDAERLQVAAALCRKVAKSLGANPTIEATTDRPAALAGADFVINMVQIGGFDSTLIDFEIPRKYGLAFTIADTTGPGGLFRALRTYPMLTDLCRDMQRLCPNAVLLNYSNPMSMNMRTIAHATPDLKAVGLCHSVQGTLNQLAGYLGIDSAEVSFTCAGVNHMAFYLRLEHAGNDLYPRLFEAMDARPEVFNSNKVRFELMRRLGYFVTESSEHSAEYSSFFIPHGKAQTSKFSVPLDEYLRRCDGIVDEFERMRDLCRCEDSELPKVHRSCEYGSGIIHAMVTGRPMTVYGNMPNRGTIPNLPATAIAEAPTTVDSSGLKFQPVGELPPQLIGYIQPHVTQHELFIRAAVEGRRDHIYQAAMFDPLTAATMPPDRIVEMCDELIAAHGSIDEGGTLPNLDARRTLVPSSGKVFPKLDPASLRSTWNARRKEDDDCHITKWHVIGPFSSPEPGKISLELPTPVESDFLARAGGSIARSVTFPASGKSPLKWVQACAIKRGFVDLGRVLGVHEWAIAYGYTEFESIHARDTVLRCGSDDGIKIWLNGQLVHTLEVGRAYVPGSDEIPVRLSAGTNRLLVKVDNYQGNWGFGVAVGRATF